jgi:hypothetical protein
VLAATALHYPDSLGGIKQHIKTAQVTDFENTLAGFFSTLSVPKDTLQLPDKSPLTGGYGRVGGIKNGMGFVVFLEDGRVSLIEGFTYGTSTSGINFATVEFSLGAWSWVDQ